MMKADPRRAANTMGGALVAATAAMGNGEHVLGAVVGVVGEPGVGKSRLCHEFVQRCRARGIPVSATQGLPHGRSIPFFLVLDLSRQYFGITEQDLILVSLKDQLSGQARNRAILVEDRVQQVLRNVEARRGAGMTSQPQLTPSGRPISPAAPTP